MCPQDVGERYRDYTDHGRMEAATEPAAAADRAPGNSAWAQAPGTLAAALAWTAILLGAIGIVVAALQT